MFSMFFPDATADSSYTVDYDKLYREGIRGIIYDIDNTLDPTGRRRMTEPLPISKS